MPPLVAVVLILSIVVVASIFCIRHAQRWVVVSVANFLEYGQPERERQGNGRTVILSLALSAAFLLYVIAAWSALATRIPNHLESVWPSRYTWAYWVCAFILNVWVPIAATKLTLGFGEYEHANSFIRLETNAHHEKADTALMFAVMSSWQIVIVSILLWGTFALAPSAAAFLFGWTARVL